MARHFLRAPTIRRGTLPMGLRGRQLYQSRPERPSDAAARDCRDQGVPCRRTVAWTGKQCRKLTKNAERCPADVAGDLSRYLDERVHLNLVAPILLAQGLFDELKAASGAIVNVTSIAGSRVHPFARTAYATSKAALAYLTRNGARLRLTWHSRKWGPARRNQDGHFVACHGSTSCAKDPTSPSGYTRRGRQGHFLPMFRCGKLCHWRRSPDRWRTTLVMNSPWRSPVNLSLMDRTHFGRGESARGVGRITQQI